MSVCLLTPDAWSWGIPRACRSPVVVDGCTAPAPPVAGRWAPDTGNSVTCQNKGEELESECLGRHTSQEGSLSCFLGEEGSPLRSPAYGNGGSPGHMVALLGALRDGACHRQHPEPRDRCSTGAGEGWWIPSYKEETESVPSLSRSQHTPAVGPMVARIFCHARRLDPRSTCPAPDGLLSWDHRSHSVNRMSSWKP